MQHGTVGGTLAQSDDWTMSIAWSRTSHPTFRRTGADRCGYHAGNLGALEEVAANAVTLVQATPRYLKAGAALKACDASLDVAPHFLHEPMTTEPGIHDAAGTAHSMGSRGSCCRRETVTTG
jgi:hypothetical protein